MANGHPESVLHVAMAAGGLMVIDFLARPTWAERKSWLSAFRVPAAGALAGLALSAPAWLPVLEQVLLSARFADLHRGAPAVSFPATILWAWVSPNGFGNPVRGNWSWILNYSIVAGGYVGSIVLVLAATAAFSRGTSRRERWWLGFALVLFLTAMNWTIVGHLLNHLPPFSFAANDKLRFVVLFLAAVVGGGTLDRLARERPPAAFLLIAAVVAGLAFYVYNKQVRLLRPVDLLAPLGVLATATVFILARRFVVAAALFCTAIELFTLNAGFNVLADARYFRPELPIVDALRAAAPREPFRIVGYEWTFLPNGPAQYGLEDIRGSDPMAYQSYVRFLAPLVVDDPRMDFDRVIDVEAPRLDFLNVRFLITEDGKPIGPKWRRIYAGADGVLCENRNFVPRFFPQPSTDASVAAEETAPGRFRLHVRAAKPLRIQSSEPAGPGWAVHIDGKDTPILPGPFLSFDAPSGNTRVDVVYRPLSFYGSLPVSALAVVLLFAWPARRPGKQ
jgi:hypothetical protein